MKKYIVWQNYNIDPEEEDYKDFLEEYYPDVTNEEEKYYIIKELNYQYLDDERACLDILLDNDIIILADIGLWDGRRRGYKELHSNNIADCLQFEKIVNMWSGMSISTAISSPHNRTTTAHIIYYIGHGKKT